MAAFVASMSRMAGNRSRLAGKSKRDPVVRPHELRHVAADRVWELPRSARQGAPRRRNPLCVLAARSRACWERGSGRQTRMRIDPRPGDGAGQARAAQSYLTAACAAPFRTNGDCALKPSAMAQTGHAAPRPQWIRAAPRVASERLRRSPLLFRRQVGKRTTPQNGRSPLLFETKPAGLGRFVSAKLPDGRVLDEATMRALVARAAVNR